MLEEEFYNGKTNLIILLNEERGEIPYLEAWENVKKGQISEQLLGETAYYFSKTDKIIKGYRHHLNSFCDLDLEFEEEIEKGADYEKKTMILNLFTPTEIHLDSQTKRYYLYYVIGNHTFHSLIKEGEIPKKI